MASTWDTTNGNVIVKFVKDGVTRDYKFAPETKLKEAIQKIASDNSLTAVNVYEKQSGGEMVDIDSSEGHKTLEEFGSLQVSCKAQGA